MLHGKRVLIVEDESLISMMLEDYLDELGCQVVAIAARLADALEKARWVEVDVAVLDINLAGDTSYPVAEVLLGRNIPFFFATGYGAQGLPKSLRGTLVLPKPFMLPQFASALSATLDRRPAT